MSQLKYYNTLTSTWDAVIVGASGSAGASGTTVPLITSITVTDSSYNALDDTAVSTSGGYIKITGSNFATGCSVVIGSVLATSVTFTSSTEVRAQIPAQAAGSYTLYLSNADGAVAMRVLGVNYGSMPSWSTSTSLSAIAPTISYQFAASSDSTVTYGVQAGSTLPSGLSLSSSGLLSGTVSGSGSTTYNFTIEATDAENQNTPRTFAFTISFTDPYFYLTTLATHANGSTIITDASSNAFEMTVAGTPRASNFTPFGTGWSNYFSGTSDYISTTASSSAFTFGTGDWTVEMWVNTVTFGNRGLFQSSTTSGGMLASAGGGGIQIYLTTGATIGVSINSTWTNTATTAMVVGVWYHIALVKSSSNVKLYINGVADSGFGTVADTTNYTATYACYGGYYSASFLCNSYISNLRVVNGTAVYTGAFTPPTTVLTTTQSSGTNIAAIASGTSLLACQSNRFIDNSTSAITQVINGSPTIQSFNPFNLTNTGSDGAMYFSGTSDYIIPASSSAFTFGTGDFTIEGWYYLTAAVSSTKYFFDCRSGGQVQAAPALLMTSSTFSYYVSGAYGAQAGTPVINSWSHIAVVRISAVTKLYVNGQQQFSFSDSTNYTSSTLRIGSEWSASGSYDWQGYISNFRVVKGTAVYTGTFTPPAVALATTQSAGTNIAAISSGTNLLTLQNKYSHNTTQGHQDSSTNQLLITSAGSPAAGTFSPFSQTGWSYYLSSGNNFANTISGTGMSPYTNSTWTMEFWIYPTGAFSLYHYVVTKGTSSNRDWGVGLTAVTASTATIYYYWSPSTGDYVTTTSGGATITVNNWYHIAVVSTSGAVVTYVNGTSVGTGTQAQFNTSNPLNLYFGSFMDYGNTFYPFVGYLSNFRYVQGTAVYTGAFTPPTNALATTQSSGTNIAAISSASSTKLLTAQSNRFVDKSPSAFTITPTGSPSVQAFSPFAPTAAYSASTVGGSVYTGTTSDWINVANSNSLKLSTSNFTIECWIYFINPNSQTYYGIVGKRTADASTGYLLFGLNSSFGLILLASSNGSGWDIANSSGSTALKKNAWYHVALVRSGSSIKAYLNGALEITVTSSAAIYDNTAALSIGNWSETQSSYPFIGYISNFRFQIGTAQYTNTFATPTSLVTATLNTNVLVNSTSTALTDVTSRTNMITASTAKISTARSKYGTGSMYFNGSSDYINMPVNVGIQGTENFTVECWVYLNDITANNTKIILLSPTSNTFGFRIGQSYHGNVQGLGIFKSNVSDNDYCAYTFATGQWYHVAVVRSGSTIYFFVNGTQQTTLGTSVGSFSFVAAPILAIGANYPGTTEYFNGYIDDLRITKYARYTTNFTPMTETFQDL